MTNRSKNKGTAWENKIVELLNNADLGHERPAFKRIPGSGALGSILHEPILQGDVMGRVRFIAKPLRIEAKTGYGGATQLTIKKDWLDKIAEEAKNSLSVPLLTGKFLNARSGVKQFVVMDLDEFIYLLREGNYYHDELERS